MKDESAAVKDLLSLHPSSLIPHPYSGRGLGARARLGEGAEVCVNHLIDQFLEAVAGPPAQHLARTGRVADEQVNFRGPVDPLVRLDVSLPVETCTREGALAELAHGVRLARGDDVVVRLRLLKHQVHGDDVVCGVAPVASRVEVAETEFVGKSEFYPRHGRSDLARHELKAPAGAFVVEQYARYAEHLVCLAVVAREVEARDLADAVGRARVEGGRLPLRNLAHLAEHLGRAGEVEAAAGLKLAQRGEYVVM